MQCCNKHVIIYSGARVSEFIRAIRSFISIDYIYELQNTFTIYLELAPQIPPNFLVEFFGNLWKERVLSSSYL